MSGDEIGSDCAGFRAPARGDSPVPRGFWACSRLARPRLRLHFERRVGRQVFGNLKSRHVIPRFDHELLHVRGTVLGIDDLSATEQLRLVRAAIERGTLALRQAMRVLGSTPETPGNAFAQ